MQDMDNSWHLLPSLHQPPLGGHTHTNAHRCTQTHTDTHDTHGHWHVLINLFKLRGKATIYSYHNSDGKAL